MKNKIELISTKNIFNQSPIFIEDSLYDSKTIGVWDIDPSVLKNIAASLSADGQIYMIKLNDQIVVEETNCRTSKKEMPIFFNAKSLHVNWSKEKNVVTYGIRNTGKGALTTYWDKRCIIYEPNNNTIL